MSKGPKAEVEAEMEVEAAAKTREPGKNKVEVGWRTVNPKTITKQSDVIESGSSAASGLHSMMSATWTSPKTTDAAVASSTTTMTSTSTSKTATSGMVTLVKGKATPSFTHRVQGSPTRGPQSLGRFQSPRRVPQKPLTPEEKKAMLADAMLNAGREQTEAGKNSATDVGQWPSLQRLQNQSMGWDKGRKHQQEANQAVPYWRNTPWKGGKIHKGLSQTRVRSRADETNYVPNGRGSNLRKVSTVQRTV